MIEKTKKQIKKNKLILVEGADDVQFFEAMLKYLQIEAQVEQVGGKSGFSQILPLFINDPNFGSLSHLVLIRDADESASSAFQSLQNLSQKYGLQPPKKRNTFSENASLSIGIFIVGERGTEKGMLENLCLQSVENHQVMPCVETFMKCLQSINHIPKNEAKARTLVFLASMHETTESIGIGALRGYWNFEAENMQELILFLKNLDD